MTNKSKSQKNNDSIWDSYYQTYQDSSILPGVRYPNEHLVRFIFDWSRQVSWPKKRRPKILELGFGTVTNMAMMSRLGCDVEGLEVSFNTTERTREAISLLGMEDTISVGTYPGGSTVPKPDAYYDAIVGL